MLEGTEHRRTAERALSHVRFGLADMSRNQFTGHCGREEVLDVESWKFPSNDGMASRVP